MEQRILVVEDEAEAAAILRDYLMASGFMVKCTDEGLKVPELVRQWQPDLVLLDLMLPGRDGLSLCRELRSFCGIPIIMTTARVEEIDRLLGLELGADDYICKPYSPREVVARVKAVLRRSSPQDDVSQNDVLVDKEGCRLIIRGRPLDLTVVEFKLFVTLHARPGRIFSREQLIASIYPDQRSVSDRTVDSHVKKLRLKIALAQPGFDCIQSVYGLGYRYGL